MTSKNIGDPDQGQPGFLVGPGDIIPGQGLVPNRNPPTVPGMDVTRNAPDSSSGQIMQQQQQNRSLWEGMLEWSERHPVNSACNINIPRTVACHTRINASEPDFDVKDWPSKLKMQFVPIQFLYRNPLRSLFGNCRRLNFELGNTDADAINYLHTKMENTYAGWVCFKTRTVLAQPETRSIVLLYSKTQNKFTGLVPHQQAQAVEGINAIIREQKHKQVMVKSKEHGENSTQLENAAEAFLSTSETALSRVEHGENSTQSANAAEAFPSTSETALGRHNPNWRLELGENSTQSGNAAEAFPSTSETGLSRHNPNWRVEQGENSTQLENAAEAFPSTSETALSRLLDCAICLHTVNNHRALPCQHSFCQECLEPMVASNELTCPICREVCKLTEKGVEGLPRNVMVMGILDQLCANCRVRTKEVFCGHCKKHICNICQQVCRDQLKQIKDKLVSDSSRLLEGANDNIQQIHQDMQSVYQQVTSISTEIDRNAKRMMQAVTDRQEALKLKLTEAGNAEMERLTSQHRELRVHIATVEAFQNLTKPEEDPPFDDLYKICENLQKEVNEGKSSCRSVQGARIKFDGTDNVVLVRQCSTFGKLHIQSSDCDKSESEQRPLKRRHSPTEEDPGPSRRRLNVTSRDARTAAANGTTDYGRICVPKLMVGGHNSSAATVSNTFSSPSRMAVSAVTGNVVICDKDNNRIQVYTDQGQLVSRFGSKGNAPGQFSFGEDRADGSVAITKRGHIVVSDTGNHRLQFFTEQGVFLKTMGQHGSDAGQFRFPSGITCCKSGIILVCDPGNQRILELDEETADCAVFGDVDDLEDSSVWCPTDIATCPNGDVVVVDNRRPAKFDIFKPGGVHKTPMVLGGLNRPMSIAVNDKGHFIVSTDRSNLLHILDGDGRILHSWGHNMNKHGAMDSPVGVACTKDGGVVVVDQNNHRVLFF